MSDKKKRETEDNRDVFEKALDMGVPGMVVGALVGGVAGRRGIPKMIRKRADREIAKGPPKGMSRKEWEDEMNLWVRDSKAQGTALGAFGGGTLGMAGQGGYRAMSDGKKRRK